MTKSLLRRTIEKDETETKSDEINPDHNSVESANRQGDSGIGRPHPQTSAISVDELSDNISAKQPEDILLQDDELLAGSFFLPASLSKILRIILFCGASIVAFFLITQTTSFLTNIRQLSILERVILSTPLVLFGAVILWLIVKLIVMANRFKISPQIKIKALQELENRRSLRKLSLKKNRQAVEELTNYLQNDLLIKGDTLTNWGIKQDFIAKLEKDRNKLIQQAHAPTGTSQDWLSDFKCNIQNQLDEIAYKRILKYSMNAAVMAGISPFPLIDRLIVLSSSLGLLKDLLELYSLKPSWDKNLVLMAQVIISTYCSGVVEDLTESAFENISNIAEEAATQIPDIALRFAGRTTESAIQGYMVFRLGKSALKLLHPII